MGHRKAETLQKLGHKWETQLPEEILRHGNIIKPHNFFLGTNPRSLGVCSQHCQRLVSWRSSRFFFFFLFQFLRRFRAKETLNGNNQNWLCPEHKVMRNTERRDKACLERYFIRGLKQLLVETYFGKEYTVVGVFLRVEWESKWFPGYYHGK